MATRTLYVDDGYAVGDNYAQTGITVDWKNKIIFVPKIAMTLVQSTPTVIYQLDLNVFRLALKELEADEGIPYDDTHQHNTEVTVGGVTLARVIEIINNYTVTFEDDQYAVNLFGANSNVGDKVNVNQVSVRSSNSAGLVTSQAIEFGEYGGGVFVKPSATSSGTTYPTGTLREPVNNLADAKLIANFRGFDKIFLLESMTIQDVDLTGFIIRAESAFYNITLAANATLTQCEFTNGVWTGTLDGGSVIRESIVRNIDFFDGIIYNSVLEGNISCGGGLPGSESILRNCTSGQVTPRIDLGGDGPPVILSSFSGDIIVENKSGNTNPICTFDMTAGDITFTSTITEGNFQVRGVGELTDNSTGNAVIINELLNVDNIWSEDVSTYVTGTAGYLQVQAGDISNANIQISGLTSDQANTLNQIDATTLSSNITITSVDNNVSNIILNGAMTGDQANQLLEIYALYGLDPTKPLVVSNTARTAGANISQTIDCNVTTETTTVTRI